VHFLCRFCFFNSEFHPEVFIVKSFFSLIALRGISILLVLIGMQFNSRWMQADVITFSLAGWEAYDDIAADTRNTSQTFNIGAGSRVTQVRWIGLTFESFGTSPISAFTIGLGNSRATLVDDIWDYNPGAGINTVGVFGPSTGLFLAGIGGPFNVLNDGLLTAEAYVFPESNAGTTGILGRDARVSAGQLEITYTAVPEPTSLVLIGCIASVCVGAYRMRRSAFLS
jgi:hypothetical protein